MHSELSFVIGQPYKLYQLCTQNCHLLYNSLIYALRIVMCYITAWYMHSELSFVIGQSNAIYVYMYGFLSMSWVLSEWHSLYNIQMFFDQLKWAHFD